MMLVELRPGLSVRPDRVTGILAEGSTVKISMLPDMPAVEGTWFQGGYMIRCVNSGEARDLVVELTKKINQAENP